MGYWEDKLGQIVGGTITKVISDDGDFPGEPFVGLIVKMPDGTQKNMWLLSDEEGNDPGRFEYVDW